MCAIWIVAEHVAVGWPIEADAETDALISLEHAGAQVLITARGSLPAHVVAVNEEGDVRLVLIVFNNGEFIRRCYQKLAKLVLRNSLPIDCPVASQFIGNPKGERPAVDTAGLAISDRSIRDPPIFRHVANFSRSAFCRRVKHFVNSSKLLHKRITVVFDRQYDWRLRENGPFAV